jgi:transcriptional regulator with XRE-family HTH domain
MAVVEAFYAGLGERVREARRARALTQAELGARLTPPVTRASVANLESGKQRVLAHTLLQLSAALDVSLAALVPAPVVERDRWALLVDELARALAIPTGRARRIVARVGGPR